MKEIMEKAGIHSFFRQKSFISRFMLILGVVLAVSGCTYAENGHQKVQISEKTAGIHVKVKNSDTAVLMIGGSGAVDLDYTVDGIPLYKQLAEGLKESGISSLRLEKKEEQYSTIEEEWIRSIESGLDYLKQRYKCVYLLGHSLSAIILPVFDQQADGMILMAGAVSEVSEVYAAQLLKHADEMEKNIILEELEQIRSLEEDSGFSWFGLPESWWISLNRLNVKGSLQTLTVPVLILSASEDELISKSEFQAYQDVLVNHSDAEFELFDGLNHFFVEKEGLHFDEAVIDKTASWILEHSSVIINKRGCQK